MTPEQEILRDLCHFTAQECDAASFRCEQAGEKIAAENQRMKAEFWYSKALVLDPENSEINYAMSYIASDKLDFASCIKHSTFAMNSAHAEHKIMSQYNRGLALLMLKDYKGGFEDYDARLQIPLNKSSRIARFGDLPYWKGEQCETLHVSGEQGFGDIFQFSRYVPLLKHKFGVRKILFEVPKSLLSFYTYNFQSYPEIEVVSEKWHPQVDYHIQLVSLCRVFGTSYDTVPPIKLRAEPSYVAKWRDPSCSKFKIGFFYSARTTDNDLQVAEWNKRREIDEQSFHRIFEGLDIEPVAITPDLNPDIKNWSDTAGLISNMDLIIGIDSGPIHLSAALGVPTLLLNHAKTCWRWNLSGYSTPWYGENLRILRQEKEYDWMPVIKEGNQYLQTILRRLAA